MEGPAVKFTSNQPIQKSEQKSIQGLQDWGRTMGSAGPDTRLAIQRGRVALLAGVHAAFANDARHSLRASDSGAIILGVNAPASTARGEVLMGVNTLESLPNPLRQGRWRRLWVDGTHAHRHRAELLRDDLLVCQGPLPKGTFLEVA